MTTENLARLILGLTRHSPEPLFVDVSPTSSTFYEEYRLHLDYFPRLPVLCKYQATNDIIASAPYTISIHLFRKASSLISIMSHAAKSFERCDAAGSIAFALAIVFDD